MVTGLLILFFTGQHDRIKDEHTKQVFDVSQLFKHKSYLTYTGYGHDIALMRLSRPAVLNEAVNLVCLPKQGQRVKTGQLCYLTGTIEDGMYLR